MVCRLCGRNVANRVAVQRSRDVLQCPTDIVVIAEEGFIDVYANLRLVRSWDISALISGLKIPSEGYFAARLLRI